MQQQNKTNESALEKRINNQTGCLKWKFNLKFAEKTEFLQKKNFFF